MKHYLSGINISLLTLVLVGVSALTALAVNRPFHLVEHGTLTTTKDGDNKDGKTTDDDRPTLKRRD